MRRRALACSVVLAGLAVMAPAHADAVVRSTYVEGAGGQAFSLARPVSSALSVITAASGQNLVMKTGELASWSAGSAAYTGLSVAHPDPRGIHAGADGSILIADAANRLVLRMSDSGAVLFAYTAADDAQLRAPVCARRLDDGSYLIVDRAADRVFIVGLNKGLRWQYGTTGVAGSGVNRLDAPTYAEERADGNIVICDAGNHRVIVVRRSDYAAPEASLGYSAASIVWQYGDTGSSGTGVDRLVRPTSAQWLTSGAAAGRALICDEGAGRVLEVRAADYAAVAADHGFDAGSVVWRYPAEGDSAQPSFALGANGGDGIVWIADAAGGRVYAVATGSASGEPTAHDVVADFGAGRAGFTGSLVAPAALSLTSEGAVAVADPGEERAFVVGTTGENAVATSKALTCGRAGRKLFASITCTYADVPFAPIGIAVSVDGSDEWTFLTFPTIGGRADARGAISTVTLPLPPKTVGTTLRYQLQMATQYRAFSPLLASLSVAWEPRASSDDDGSGGERGNGAGNGTGDYTYPGATGGSGQGSGGGTGGGTGGGSGSGAGSGYGSGSSGSVTGADAGAPVAGGATGADLPAAVDPAATAPGSEAVVSGYRMRASGFAGGGAGGGGSTPERASSAADRMLLPAVLGLLCLALFAAAALAHSRRIRVYAEFDPDRPRALPADITPTARPPLPPLIIKPTRW